MRLKLKITGPGTHEQVRDAFRKESDPKRRRKLQAIRLGFMGEHTTEEIAEIVGCAKSSVTAWVKAYREGDIEGLLTTHHKPGREDITEALRPFWESPKPTLSLLGADNYLLVSANAS